MRVWGSCHGTQGSVNQNSALMTEYGRKDTLSFETKNLVHPQGKHDCLWVHFCLSRPQRFEFVRQTDSKCFLPSARTLGADVCTAKLPHLRYEDGTSWGIRMLTRAIVDPNDLAQASAQVTFTHTCYFLRSSATAAWKLQTGNFNQDEGSAQKDNVSPYLRTRFEMHKDRLSLQRLAAVSSKVSKFSRVRVDGNIIRSCQ